MRSNPASQALAKASMALESMSDATLRKIPLADCAQTLSALPNMTTLTGIRGRLAERLQSSVHVPWIERGDAAEVFAALAALWKYDPAYITDEQFACAVRRLLRTEAAVGGPYYSSYSDKTTGVVANIHIAIFMRLAAKPLPNLETFFDHIIAAERFNDTELTDVGLLYSLAKACDAGKLSRYMINYHQQAGNQTPEFQAVALHILKGNMSAAETNKTIALLCKSQLRSGFWNGASFQKTVHSRAGSQVVVTALAVEALADYQHNRAETSSSDLQKKHQVVIRAARQLFDVRTEPVRSSALAMIERVQNADENFEIASLPRLFAGSLKTPSPLTDQQYTTLGLASVYGWVAYTIYDDFLDCEGAPSMLPAANIAVRASMDSFREALPDQDGFQRRVADIFTAMDEANAWEVGNCRFPVQSDKVTISALPKYGDCAVLATRSFAHAMTALAVLVRHSSSTPARIRAIESGFRHYLIARQLNDDMRDWQGDIQTGQASYVVTAILRDMHLKPGTYRLYILLPAMRKYFRRTTMPKIARLARQHIDESRNAFAASHLLRSANDIYGLLNDIERSLKRSLDGHAKTQALLTTTSVPPDTMRGEDLISDKLRI